MYFNLSAWEILKSVASYYVTGYIGISLDQKLASYQFGWHFNTKLMRSYSQAIWLQWLVEDGWGDDEL